MPRTQRSLKILPHTYSRSDAALQIDRIDPLYLARSDRVDVREETRFKATSDEVAKWAVQTRVEGGMFSAFNKRYLSLMTEYKDPHQTLYLISSI